MYTSNKAIEWARNSPTLPDRSEFPPFPSRARGAPSPSKIEGIPSRARRAPSRARGASSQAGGDPLPSPPIYHTPPKQSNSNISTMKLRRKMPFSLKCRAWIGLQLWLHAFLPYHYLPNSQGPRGTAPVMFVSGDVIWLTPVSGVGTW